jgi:hypothetical protein
MPTQLEQATSSLLTWSAYKKLAMSVSWQIQVCFSTQFSNNQSKFFLEICEPKLHTNIKTNGEVLFILSGLPLFPEIFQVFVPPSLQNFVSKHHHHHQNGLTSS